jgi:hypothetical protein
MNVAKHDAIFHIALKLREVVEEEDSVQSKLKETLTTAIFVRLCELLPRSLRKRTKAQEASEVLASDVIVDWLCPIVGEFPSFDMECLAVLDPKCIYSALRACLKYGMLPLEGLESFGAISSRCLRLARELVLGIPAASSKTPETGSFPSPSEAFEMVVSHSQFNQCLTAVPNNSLGATRKLELIRLMLSCVSLSDTVIVFEKGIWDSLFRSYDASVGIIDATLRRLLYISTKRQAEVRCFAHAYYSRNIRGSLSCVFSLSQDFVTAILG